MTFLQMHAQPVFSHHCSALIFFVFLLFIIAVPTCWGEDDDWFTQCSSLNYSCGTEFPDVGYPFWGGNVPQHCGHPGFFLLCPNNEYPVIETNNQILRVLRIDQANSVMSVALLGLWDIDNCPEEYKSVSIENESQFVYTPAVRNLTLFFYCRYDDPGETGNWSNSFKCLTKDGRESEGGYANESIIMAGFPAELGISCEVRMEVPVLRSTVEELSNGSATLQEGLRRGFEVVYLANRLNCSACEHSGGICGSDNSTGREFVCLCRDGVRDLACVTPGRGINWRRKVIVGVSASMGTLLAVGLAVFIYRHRKRSSYAASSWTTSQITSSYASSKKDLEKASTYYGVQVFSYSELEKATTHFDSKKELGEGGFGSVYLGKLRDGRVVAVKRLYENNYRRVEQFMNEVEILARLRHRNLVTLYGCTSYKCQVLLLVYEYIPNGTVADHLHGRRSKPGSLSWTTRMSIAVETASALAYLHASDVIHRDVKTNNILLDSNFCVKVADFGLSRLFPTDVTHVSTAPQGTPGYVDPEYHECYQLTGKSDVYSFGVVLVELISSKPAVDITRHRHEINLSTMAINKIQSHALHELIDPILGFESDYKVRMMITKVAELAFQCLQNGRDMRPNMEEVLEILKGIQTEGYDSKHVDELDVPEDDIVLLKSDPAARSPDSVAAQWISRSSTPNPSA